MSLKEPSVDTSVAPQAARTTRQKRAVATALDTIDGFTSAQELHGILRSSGQRVGLATVYSQLRSLAANGEVDSMRSESGEMVFRRCEGVSHHHHLVCRECGKAIEIEAPALETWTAEVGLRHGFSKLAHVLEITGTCASCTTSHGAS